MAGKNLHPCVIGGQNSAHALVGLDGRQALGPVRQQPCEDACSRSYLEDIGRIAWNEPVECFVGRPGPKAVVLVCHLAERAPEDGGLLVLAHESAI